MFYKISNTAEKETIETAFDATFKYPNLYQPNVVVNGLKESSLSIITIDEPDFINYGIWGLLPEEFEDNWEVFQNITNTLNINIEKLNGDSEFYKSALHQRRCLILVTGFFTSFLDNGNVHPYHVHLKNYEPFCIAGIYNQLQDGFLTCSMLVKKAKNSFLEIPNLSGFKPLIFKPKDYKLWLDKNKDFDDLKELVERHETYTFESHPLKDKFYKDRSLYKSIKESNSFKAWH